MSARQVCSLENASSNANTVYPEVLTQHLLMDSRVRGGFWTLIQIITAQERRFGALASTGDIYTHTQTEPEQSCVRASGGERERDSVIYEKYLGIRINTHLRAIPKQDIAC